MVRPNELSFARRGALSKLADRARGARPGHLVGRLVGLDSEDDHRAIVAFGDAEVSVLSGPHKLVPGALVAVEVDSTNAPTRITGPVTTRPEGLDEDIPAPDAVVPMPELGPVEFSPEDQAILDQTVADLAVAQADLQDAFERIGNLATEVGFSWSGSFEADWPAGSDFRVDWVALGGGEFRLEMKNIPTGANFGWAITLPQGGQVYPTTNPVLVTATEAGSLTVYAWADDENIYVDNPYFEVHPAMLDATGPLQAAIADASAAAVRASRIAPRSLREPTIEDGADRPTGSIWTQVNAEGEELAYWAWTGTEWVPQALSTQVIPYLDAAHISTGVLDADRINVTEIWGQIATFGKIITEQLIATGAVTAEALNVVHVDPETGYGWRAEPEGLTFLDQEGNPAIVLRTDMANYFNIVKTIEGAGGPESVSVASISPEGDLTGRSVAANESLLYRGTELQESLNGSDRGIMAMARNTAPVSIGSSEGRLLAVSFQAPSDNRMVTIQVMGRVATSERRRATIRLKQSATGTVTPLNSTQKTWYIQTDWAESFDLSVTRSVGEWGWVAGDTVTVGVFVESLTAGEALSFPDGAGQEIIVKDAGPWLAIQGHAPWAPPSGGGDGGGDETAPTPRAYTRSWNSTGHRTYSTTSLTSTRAASSLVQGYWAGANSRGHWIFPDSSIRTALSGASNMTGTLKIRNQGTGTGSMTAVLKVHNYASAPSSFGTTQAWTTVTVASGRDVEVAVPAWILNGFRDNTIKGVSLDHGTSTSKSFYGYFSPSASLKINYRK